MSHDPKINELEQLLQSTDPSEAGFDGKAARAAVLLDELADVLRDPQQRDPLGGTTLVISVTRAMGLKGTGTAYYTLLKGAARVAANLVADCDVNRTRLAEAKYPQKALAQLASRPVLPLDVLRPLVASILNMVVEGHAESVAAIASHDDLAILVSLASEVYTPGKWTDDGADGIAGWLWTIAQQIIPSPPTYSLSAKELQSLLPIMGAFAPRSRPATSSDEDAEHVDADLIIVSHAASVLDKFNQADKVQGVMGDQALLEAMFDFVERAELPPWVTFEVDDDEDEEEEANGKPKEQKVPGQEQEKTLRHAKGDVARTVVSLIDASAPEWVWKRIATWLDMDGRPDLVSCALLGYGNKARSDADATALLPTILPYLPKLMVPESDVLVQHGLIGLVRNLSIPEVNKALLGDAGVVEKLVVMEPWKESRDVLGSIQGGAIGIIKNLVRTTPNAVRFMSTSGPDEVHALIARTNDGAIAMEGSRIWVNAVRVLSRRDASDTASETPWRALCTPAIAGDLCGMISRGEKYLALVAEGVVALTLLVAFGGMGAEVADALMRDPNPAGVPQQDKGKEARVPAMALAGVLAPTPERPVSAEVQANTIALLKLLPRGPLGELVRSEIKAAREAGRAVAPGVEMLDE